MSINVVCIACPNCGAPVSGPTCLYCETAFQSGFAPTQSLQGDRARHSSKGLFEVRLGQTSYFILGLLAQGEKSQVLLARRAGAVTEQVVIKVGGTHLETEWEVLRHLQGRRAYLDRLLPQSVGLGQIRDRTCLLYRWRSGFVYTLAQARSQYPKGVEPEAAVWMWNRILDQLICLRELGYSHGDLRLEHLLVHPRDHGIAFCGWGKARLGPQGDLAASAHCVSQLLGSKAPGALKELTRRAPQFQSPHQLKQELQKVARRAFGPPRFRTFTLGG